MINIPNLDFSGNHVMAFIACLSEWRNEGQKLWSFLSDQEKIKARQFANSVHKENYIIAHGLLKILLSSYTSIPPQYIEYSYNEFGKPFLKSNNSFQFNMSHSGEKIAFAIAQDIQIGIDIEYKKNKINVNSIAEMIMSPTEAFLFHQLEEKDKPHSFFDFWTKKEAILKAAGKGLSYPFNKIDVSDLSSNKAVVNHYSYYHSVLNIAEDYAAAVATNCKTSQITCTNMVAY